MMEIPVLQISARPFLGGVYIFLVMITILALLISALLGFANLIFVRTVMIISIVHWMSVRMVDVSLHLEMISVKPMIHVLPPFVLHRVVSLNLKIVMIVIPVQTIFAS
jgi:hypothetical protein